MSHVKAENNRVFFKAFLLKYALRQPTLHSLRAPPSDVTISGRAVRDDGAPRKVDL
jgi:hypothetical protein